MVIISSWRSRRKFQSFFSILIYCFCIMQEVPVEPDSRCLARLSVIFECRVRFVSRLYEASNLIPRQEQISKQFQKDRCWGEARQVQRRILEGQISIYVPDREIMREIHGEMIDSSLPNALLGARYFALPFQHVESSIAVIHWFSNKAIRMVTSPLFPLLFQTIDNQLVHLFLFTHRIITSFQPTAMLIATASIFI